MIHPYWIGFVSGVLVTALVALWVMIIEAIRGSRRRLMAEKALAALGMKTETPAYFISTDSSAAAQPEDLAR